MLEQLILAAVVLGCAAAISSAWLYFEITDGGFDYDE
jgi:hypothetical protein